MMRSRILRALAAILVAMLAPDTAQAQDADAETKPFNVDNNAMCQFEYHLGEWAPGDPEAPPGIRIVFEWVIPAKAVRDAEHHLIDGEEVLIHQGVAGYHYGRMRIDWVSYVRDGVRPFEVMNQGEIEFEPGDVMVRRYRSYDPDTSSREYRETLSPIDENTRRNRIEYLNDEREWKEWGVFTHVRTSPRVTTPECEGLVASE